MNWTNRQVLMKLLVYRSSFLLYHIPSVDHDYTPNIAHRIRHVHLPIVPEVMKIKLCSNLQEVLFSYKYLIQRNVSRKNEKCLP